MNRPVSTSRDYNIITGTGYQKRLCYVVRSETDFRNSENSSGKSRGPLCFGKSRKILMIFNFYLANDSDLREFRVVSQLYAIQIPCNGYRS